MSDAEKSNVLIDKPDKPAHDVGETSAAAIELVDTQERLVLSAQDAPYGVRADGTPAKKRGRRPGIANKKSEPAETAVSGIPARVEVDYQFMSRGIVNAELNLLVAILGKDWEPKAELEEAKHLRDGWAAYLESKGIKAFPPEVVLIMAHVAYIAPRLSSPSTKTRLARLREWGQGLFKRSVDTPLKTV
jgi:hypothetical protein